MSSQGLNKAQFQLSDLLYDAFIFGPNCVSRTNLTLEPNVCSLEHAGLILYSKDLVVRQGSKLVIGPGYVVVFVFGLCSKINKDVNP
ncbi:hypothetical protein HYC85_031904 [Camellia sinensis]|uniref:Uncharacterized protein n=1 Tax=Camellia sinensis TaxID=4442 RepID=A0A7J7FSP5_CAMSI|nr:hypothetical protein HYC85_031904 [Camellia sinensis]